MPPPALSCSYSLVSEGLVCPHLGLSWHTHPWERDLLPAAGGGQSGEQACCASKAGWWLAPLTPVCLTKIAAMERGLLTFFFSFSFSFFFSSCAQTSPDLLRRLWHIILQMWHRSLGCKIYPAWQLVVLCNLHQLTETTVRYY